MSVFTITLNQMIALFIIVMAGYILTRAKMIQKEWIDGLMKLLANFFLPVLIFNSLQLEISPELAKNGLFFSWTYVVFCLVGMGLGLLFAKLFRIKNGSELCCWASCSWIPNIAFVGVPIIQVLLPPEALFYTSLSIVSSLLLTFTFGIFVMDLCSKKSGTKISAKTLLNPCTIALLLGFLTLFLDIPMPKALLSATGMLTSATTPLAMLAIGSIMSRIPFRSIFSSWQIYVVLVIKLIILPVIAYFVMSIFSPDYIFLAVFVISAAMPMPAPLLASLTAHGGDLMWGTRFVVVSTLASIITLPVTVMLFL